MRIADADLDVEAVLEALGVEVVEQRGRWGDALCPLHHEGDPSFGVNLDHGGWICRHEDETGQLVDLVMALREVPRHEALRWMTDTAPRQDHSVDELIDALTGWKKLDEDNPLAWTESFFSEYKDDEMAEYWFDRGFTEETMRAFDVRLWGGAGLPHIMWPVKDENGNILSFIKRAVAGGGYRYMYSKGFERTLFPLDHFEGDEAVLVEGPLDAMWMHQHGHRGALAMLGPGVTAGQEAWLRGHVTKVVLALDNDVEGRRGTERLLARLGSFDLRVAAVPLPAKDVQEVPREDLKKMLASARIGASAYSSATV